MSQSNYFIFNKSLAKNIGIEETYMLLTLIDANNIFKQKWFFQTSEMLEELTGLRKDRANNTENRAIKKEPFKWVLFLYVKTYPENNTYCDNAYLVTT